MGIDIPENSKKLLIELLINEINRIEHKINKIRDELINYERKYNISSSEFYSKFESGDMGDEEDFFSWYSIYDIFLSVSNKKDTLESIKLV